MCEHVTRMALKGNILNLVINKPLHSSPWQNGFLKNTVLKIHLEFYDMNNMNKYETLMRKWIYIEKTTQKP